MAICIFFLSMVHGNIYDLLHDSNIGLKIPYINQNIKAIFLASGGKAEMIVCGAFQSRGFLLILYRERQILKLIKFWLSLLLTRANG